MAGAIATQFMGHRGECASATESTIANRSISVFNHDQSGDAEAEYDRLRGLARDEASKRHHCFDQVRDKSEALARSRKLI